jgi:hypothetical protein
LQPQPQQTLHLLSIQILISGLTQRVITALISATSQEENMTCLGTHSWLPFFSGEEAPGNSHWAQFCDGFDFHLDGQHHLDVFMKLFASSLI